MLYIFIFDVKILSVVMFVVFFFFFKQKTAYEMLRSLVGSEMCIRDRACLLDRSRSSTFRASTAPAREADSYSIRHKVFSRSGTSRRRHSRSIRDRDTAFVVSSTSRRRSTEAGNPGASQCCLPAHQASQEPTAARLRFQVDSAHPPHNRVRASPSSASLTPARSRSCLLYTSDAADEEDSVDLGGRRIIKKKKKIKKNK